MIWGSLARCWAAAVGIAILCTLVTLSALWTILGFHPTEKVAVAVFTAFFLAGAVGAAIAAHDFAKEHRTETNNERK